MRSGPEPGVGYAADGAEMRSMERGGGGGGTGWALSCSTAYMVRAGNEPRARLTNEKTGPFIYVSLEERIMVDPLLKLNRGGRRKKWHATPLENPHVRVEASTSRSWGGREAGGEE